MPRARRILASALFLSLAAHLLALASAGSWWTPPAAEIPFPIEANLTLPARDATPAARPARPPARNVAAAPAPAAQVEAPPAAAPPEPVAAVPPPGEGVAQPAVPVAPPPTALSTEPPAAAPAQPAPPPALRQLPAQLRLRYAVQAGEGGFNLGQAVYDWQQQDGRYTLVSTAQATGVASLFVSGKLVQTSEGRIVALGLQPEHYWLVRNERKQDVAYFDWVQQRLNLGGTEVELPPASQDLLSFPFHLAMTVDETLGEWTLWVSNGRKLRDYQFRNLGRERLTLGEAEVDVLHLQGSRAGEGTLDVWLAPSRHWLPLRIRTLDQKGRVMVLSLEA